MQASPDHLASGLTTSYGLMWLALVAALLVELICWRRVRRFNAWLSLLGGAAVCLQTIVVWIGVTLRWDERLTAEVILRVALLGFAAVAALGLWLAARRVWLERGRSRGVLACLRALALALLLAAFGYQAHWGLGILDLVTQPPRA